MCTEIVRTLLGTSVTVGNELLIWWCHNHTLCLLFSRQVLSVRAGGTLGVVVRGVGRDHTFRMEDRGTISSLKFSPDHTVLAVQRNKNSVVKYETSLFILTFLDYLSIFDIVCV